MKKHQVGDPNFYQFGHKAVSSFIHHTKIHICIQISGGCISSVSICTARMISAWFERILSASVILLCVYFLYISHCWKNKDLVGLFGFACISCSTGWESQVTNCAWGKGCCSMVAIGETCWGKTKQSCNSWEILGKRKSNIVKKRVNFRGKFTWLLPKQFSTLSFFCTATIKRSLANCIEALCSSVELHWKNQHIVQPLSCQQHFAKSIFQKVVCKYFSYCFWHIIFCK